jgi:hypothetical protein
MGRSGIVTKAKIYDYLVQQRVDAPGGAGRRAAGDSPGFNASQISTGVSGK